MQNEAGFAGHLLSSGLPWHLAQGSTDRLIDYCQRQGVTFGARMGEKFHRAFVGSAWVGLLHPETLDLIAWPRIDNPATEADFVAWLHESADASSTRAKCYFIGGETGAIKIGYSIDVPARLKAMRSHSPVYLDVLAARDGGEAREMAYHRQFAAHRLHGEWFERCSEIETEIERLRPRSVAGPRAHHRCHRRA